MQRMKGKQENAVTFASGNTKFLLGSNMFTLKINRKKGERVKKSKEEKKNSRVAVFAFPTRPDLTAFPSSVFDNRSLFADEAGATSTCDRLFVMTSPSSNLELEQLRASQKRLRPEDGAASAEDLTLLDSTPPPSPPPPPSSASSSLLQSFLHSSSPSSALLTSSSATSITFPSGQLSGPRLQPPLLLGRSLSDPTTERNAASTDRFNQRQAVKKPRLLHQSGGGGGGNSLTDDDVDSFRALDRSMSSPLPGQQSPKPSSTATPLSSILPASTSSTPSSFSASSAQQSAGISSFSLLFRRSDSTSIAPRSSVGSLRLLLPLFSFVSPPVEQFSTWQTDSRPPLSPVAARSIDRFATSLVTGEPMHRIVLDSEPDLDHCREIIRAFSFLSTETEELPQQQPPSSTFTPEPPESQK